MFRIQKYHMRSITIALQIKRAAIVKAGDPADLQTDVIRQFRVVQEDNLFRSPPAKLCNLLTCGRAQKRKMQRQDRDCDQGQGHLGAKQPH